MTIPIECLTRGSRIVSVRESLVSRRTTAVETVRGITGDFVLTDQRDWVVYEEDGRRVIGDKADGDDPFDFVFHRVLEVVPEADPVVGSQRPAS